jgi:hypothetical protein
MGRLNPELVTTTYSYRYRNVYNFVNSSCTSVPQISKYTFPPQAFVSFKKYMPPPLPYFKVNISRYTFPRSINKLWNSTNVLDFFGRWGGTVFNHCLFFIH